MISSRIAHTSSVFLLHQPLGRFHRLGVFVLDQLADDERLEQLDRHVLGQTALVQLQFGTDHDHGAARIVHALAEQVLAETALLALQIVGQALERTVAVAAHGHRLAAVVEQRIHRLLQHALFVAQNDLGRADLDQPLQTIVADDDAAVQDRSNRTWRNVRLPAAPADASPAERPESPTSPSTRAGW